MTLLMECYAFTLNNQLVLSLQSTHTHTSSSHMIFIITSTTSMDNNNKIKSKNYNLQNEKKKTAATVIGDNETLNKMHCTMEYTAPMEIMK